MAGPSRTATGASYALLGFQGLYACGAAAIVFLRPLEIAGCSDGECDYHLLWLVTQFFWMVDFAVLLGTALLWVTFRRRSWGWAIAAGGTAITLVTVTTANLIIDAALGKGLF